MSDSPAHAATDGASAAASGAAAARERAVRRFGRFQLLALLGTSTRTMAWRVSDPRTHQELVLVLPRHQPGQALEAWSATLRKATRVRHPHLAPVVEQGVVDGWPYAAYVPRDTPTLSERLTPQGLASADVAQWAAPLLEALAFAHEAGLAHHDVQPYLVLLDDNWQPRLLGLEVALDATMGYGSGRGAAALDTPSLAAQRDAAARDVLCAGLLMHHALAGTPALEQSDTGIVVDALPPAGREIVRLPWASAQPIAEALRAIVNRATDRQERQRYRNARTLARALRGWLQANAENGSGPLALLLDRLHTVGLLPASPGAADRAARMALMVREHTSELAEVVLRDIALSFEMLQAVNTAHVRGAQIAGTGPVLTVRRAIAMLGLDGVRQAALSLRAWPGPLSGDAEAALARLFERVRRAGRIAQALRPPGYDAEVVFLVTLMQNLGRLAVQYHFADEAAQIRRLMEPAPPSRAGEREEPGMSEEAASLAVLGTDIEALGAAVARHWGLDATVLHLVRRLSTEAPVRNPDNDDDVLRAVASCGNETIDALALPAARQADALQRIANRYARALGIGLRELTAAVAGRGTVVETGGAGGAGGPAGAQERP